MIEPVNTSAPRPHARRREQADAASKGFEQMLVQQLAQEMLKTAGDTGNQYASLLPDALAEAVEDGGGLGSTSASAGGLVSATLVHAPASATTSSATSTPRSPRPAAAERRPAPGSVIRARESRRSWHAWPTSRPRWAAAPP
jgi:hypothetical protein